jgi:hypothetical protein
MARPRTPIGTFGDIDFTTLGPERVRARTRVRDFDGQVRRVEATAPSRKLAEHRLKEKLAQRATHAGGSRQLTPDSSFKELVEVWLADLDLEGGLAPSTRALYERNMRQLVMPAFEHYTLREVPIGRIEPFLKSLAANKSYSYAKQAKTVLNLALGLAARYEAIPKNPVREAKRMKKPQSQAVSLTHDQVEAIRAGARAWRRGPGVPGPPPDGQLEQIIEVMLGTSAGSARCWPSASATWMSPARRRPFSSAARSSPRRDGRPLANRIRRRRHQPGWFLYRASRLRCCESGSSLWLTSRLITCCSSAATTRPSRRTTSVSGCAASCKRWESRESRRIRSAGPSRLSSIAPAVRIWPRRCSATARLTSRRSTTSSQTRQ